MLYHQPGILDHHGMCFCSYLMPDGAPSGRFSLGQHLWGPRQALLQKCPAASSRFLTDWRRRRAQQRRGLAAEEGLRYKTQEDKRSQLIIQRRDMGGRLSHGRRSRRYCPRRPHSGAGSWQRAPTTAVGRVGGPATAAAPIAAGCFFIRVEDFPTNYHVCRGNGQIVWQPLLRTSIPLF